MRSKRTIAAKVYEVSLRIAILEREIAQVETGARDGDSIKDKIFDLKRKLRLFREVLRNYPSTPFDFRNVC
ncbi:MAG: cytochrome P450 [Bacteroidota bacterium]|nr:cytochrome P450 [Bacteroidota bacterium]